MALHAWAIGHGLSTADGRKLECFKLAINKVKSFRFIISQTHSKRQSKLGLLSQQFFVTFDWVLLARVLHYRKLERLVSDKHSSLLGPF